MALDQAYFRLDDLPYELKYEIIRFVGEDEWGRGSLLNTACVNSHYNEIASQLIDHYEFDHIRDFHGYGFQKFIQTMTSDNGARAVHMKRLHLTTSWYESAYNFYGPGCTSKHDPADIFGVWTMHYMSGLRELMVAYKLGLTFLNADLPPNLQTLIIRPEGLEGFQFKREGRNPVEFAGTVDANFIPAVLCSKSLKKFDLGAEIIANDYSILYSDVPIKESSIEHMALTVGNFGDRALLKLLQAPRELRSLKFTPPRFEDINYEDADRTWSPTLDAANLPAISTFGAGLAAQAATLGSLTIRRADSYWRPSLDQIGSLTDFKALKHLDINCTMLLGWNHCEHLVKDDQNSAISPSFLPELLPASIENLALGFEDYHQIRNEKSYVLDILKSLKMASLTRLPNLRKITLDFLDQRPYCEQCEVTAFLNDGTSQSWMQALRSYSLGHREARAIRDLVKDAPFEFECRNNGRYWDEVLDMEIDDPDAFEQHPWSSSSWSVMAEADWDGNGHDSSDSDDSELDYIPQP